MSTREVVRTFRVVFHQNGEPTYIDYGATRIDLEGRYLVIYRGDKIAAIWAEDTWDFVREYNKL